MEFKLQPWEIKFKNDLAKNANNPNIARFLTDMFPSPYTLNDAEQFIAKATANQPYSILAITVNGEAVGGIGVHPKTGIESKNAELGYWLAEKYWGYGIMTQAVRQMVKYGFDNFDFSRIYARPFGNNPGSIRVLEKSGFVFEARFEKTLFKNGVFLDELYYAVRK